jgi:flagellar biosynthesis chaperone FliJ
LRETIGHEHGWHINLLFGQLTIRCERGTGQVSEEVSQMKKLKKHTAVRCALVMFLAYCPVTFAQQAAQSQNKQPQTAPSVTETQQKNIQEYIELLRSNVRQQKAEIMAALMGLDVDQSAKFWPIYSEYDAELTRLNNLRVANIQDYARNYGEMTDAKADELVQNAFNYRKQRSELLAKYYGRVRDSLGAVEAARFLQIEDQLLAIIDLQIASALPIVG